MPMTRELKKRFMGIDDRIEKLEKRKPVQRTNGEDVSDIPDDTDTRLDNIEAVLQIPGEKVGDTQVLSAWRQVVETILKKLEDRILQVELRASWTPKEGKDLETKVRDLQTRDRHLTQEMNDNRPTLKKHEERLHNLEVKPVAGSLSNILQDVTLEIEGNTREVKDLRSRLRVITWFNVGLFVLILFILTMTII